MLTVNKFMPDNTFSRKNKSDFGRVKKGKNSGYSN